MQVIGLTGGIASGKSTVSYYLITHGYEVIDADDISRHALEPGTEAFKQVIEHFPVLDNGIINRQKLADIIFNNQDEKNYLEGILHPYIRSVIVQKINLKTTLFLLMYHYSLRQAGMIYVILQ